MPLSRNVLRHGSEGPPTERIPLRAGPLSMIFEPGTAFLRHVRFGGREVLRGVYMAVRDRHWGTVAPRVSDLKLRRSEESFDATFDVECGEGEIRFAWTGRLSGDERGEIAFSFEGVAQSSFSCNRIGFCVLHPIRECSGGPAAVEHADGSVERGSFPDRISPRQPFTDVRSISHGVVPGLAAEVRFGGEVFEMEDQRNWTDASFKTYPRPLRLASPFEVKEGESFAQSVVLSLKGEVPAAALKIQAAPGAVEISLLDEGPSPLPRMGFGMASHGRPLSGRECERLKALALSHLRVDLRLADTDCPEILRLAAEEARRLGVSLEAAVFLSDAAGSELAELAGRVEDLKPPVSAWLVFPSTEEWCRLARRILADCAPGAKLGAGTDGYFAELNRRRPPVEAIDFAAYSMHPQVHTFDDASMVETLETQGTTVRDAREFCGGLPIAVTPVTLKGRRARGGIGPEAGQLPPGVDARQMSLFAAGWTLGSLRYLAEAGACSVTYFETTGWKGVMETEEGPPVPDRFRSIPGCVFPVYHLFADIGEFAGGEVLRTSSSDPLAADGIAVRRGGRRRILVANMRAETTQVLLRGAGRPGRIRFLDETNAEQAMRSPEDFRAQEGEPLKSGKLQLLPHALARIDLVGE